MIQGIGIVKSVDDPRVLEVTIEPFLKVVKNKVVIDAGEKREVVEIDKVRFELGVCMRSGGLLECVQRNNAAC
jgi:hypothetical protein